MLFLGINILILFLVYIFSRLGSIGWEVVLTLKHKGDVDNFIVTVSLVYAASFGAVVGFSFSNFILDGWIMLSAIYSFFILMNIIILFSTTFIGVYIANEVGKYQKQVIAILFLPLFALTIYESLVFHTSTIKAEMKNDSVKSIFIDKKIYNLL